MKSHEKVISWLFLSVGGLYGIPDPSTAHPEAFEWMVGCPSGWRSAVSYAKKVYALDLQVQEVAGSEHSRLLRMMDDHGLPQFSILTAIEAMPPPLDDFIWRCFCGMEFKRRGFTNQRTMAHGYRTDAFEKINARGGLPGLRSGLSDSGTPP